MQQHRRCRLTTQHQRDHQALYPGGDATSAAKVVLAPHLIYGTAKCISSEARPPRAACLQLRTRSTYRTAGKALAA